MPDETSDLYIETFLIDTSPDLKRDWAISKSNVDDIVGTFIDCPLTLFPPEMGKAFYDHPIIEISPGKYQNKKWDYAIGSIKSIKKTADGVYRAVSKITDKVAADIIRKWNSDKIPIYVSPGIWRKSGQNDLNITEWFGDHLSIVSNPANDRGKALLFGSCEGSEQKCLQETSPYSTSGGNPYKTASTLFESQGYCMGRALNDYLRISLSSQSEIPNQDSYRLENMSAVNSTGQSEITTSKVSIPPGKADINFNTSPATGPAVNNNNNNNPPTVSQEPQKQEAKEEIKEEIPKVDWEKKFKELEKLTSTEKKTAEERLAALEGKIKESEMATRKSEIRRILHVEPFLSRDGKINQKQYDATVEKYLHSHHDLEEVQTIADAELIKYKHENTPKEQSSPQQQSVMQTSSMSNFHGVPEIKTASGSNHTASSIPLWQQVVNYSLSPFRLENKLQTK